MLSFQKLRVYQRSIEFLALALQIIGELPKGHADVKVHGGVHVTDRVTRLRRRGEDLDVVAVGEHGAAPAQLVAVRVNDFETALARI